MVDHVNEILFAHHSEAVEDDTTSWALCSAESAAEYYSRTHRGGDDERAYQETRREENQTSVFMNGLVACYLSKRPDIALRIWAWTQANFSFDKAIDTPYETTKEDSAAFTAIGLTLTDAKKNAADITKLREVVAKGRPKRAKAILDAFDAIQAKDEKAFRKAMEALMKDFHREEMYYGPAHHATIFWNMALCAGMKPEPLPEKDMDYIMRPETIGPVSSTTSAS
jgi:hypothetical protein